MTSNSSTFDATQPTYVSLPRAAGYQTYISGKWHLGHGGIHDPRGFDRWAVLEEHGSYHDAELKGELRRPQAELGDTQCLPAPVWAQRGGGIR